MREGELCSAHSGKPGCAVSPALPPNCTPASPHSPTPILWTPPAVSPCPHPASQGRRHFSSHFTLKARAEARADLLPAPGQYLNLRSGFPPPTHILIGAKNLIAGSSKYGISKEGNLYVRNVLSMFFLFILVSPKIPVLGSYRE